MEEEKEIKRLCSRTGGNFDPLLSSLKQKREEFEEKYEKKCDEYVQLQQKFESFKKNHGLNTNANEFVQRRQDKSPLTLLKDERMSNKTCDKLEKYLDIETQCNILLNHNKSTVDNAINIIVNKVNNINEEEVIGIKSLLMTYYERKPIKSNDFSKWTASDLIIDAIHHSIEIGDSGRINVTNVKYWISLNYLKMHIFDVGNLQKYLSRYVALELPRSIYDDIVAKYGLIHNNDLKQQFLKLRNHVISSWRNNNVISPQNEMKSNEDDGKYDGDECLNVISNMIDTLNNAFKQKVMKCLKTHNINWQHFAQKNDGLRLNFIQLLQTEQKIKSTRSGPLWDAVYQKYNQRGIQPIDTYSNNKDDDNENDDIDVDLSQCQQMAQDTLSKSEDDKLITYHYMNAVDRYAPQINVANNDYGVDSALNVIDEHIEYEEYKDESVTNPSIFISEQCTQKAIDNKVIYEYFATRQKLFHFLKSNGKIQQIDGYFKVFSAISNKKRQILLFNTELHAAKNKEQILYIVAVPNDKKTPKWKMEQVEGFMTSNQIYQQYGIKEKDLPIGSRVNCREYQETDVIVSGFIRNITEIHNNLSTSIVSTCCSYYDTFNVKYTESTINNISIDMYPKLKPILTKQMKQKHKQNAKPFELSSTKFHEYVCKAIERGVLMKIISFHTNKTVWIIQKVLPVKLANNTWISLIFDKDHNPISFGIDCNDIKSKIKLFDPSINMNQYKWFNNNNITKLKIKKDKKKVTEQRQQRKIKQVPNSKKKDINGISKTKKQKSQKLVFNGLYYGYYNNGYIECRKLQKDFHVLGQVDKWMNHSFVQFCINKHDDAVNVIPLNGPYRGSISYYNYNAECGGIRCDSFKNKIRFLHSGFGAFDHSLYSKWEGLRVEFYITKNRYQGYQNCGKPVNVVPIFENNNYYYGGYRNDIQ